MGRFKLFPRIQDGTLEGDVAIIGLGRFGSAMAKELVESGVSVLGIDKDPDVVQNMHSFITQVVRADASNVEALRQLGVHEFTNAVVAIGSDLTSSILTTNSLIKLNGPEIWAKASTEQHGEILTQMGIEHVFHPEADMGVRAAHLLTRSVSDYFDLGHGFALATTTIPERLGGKTMRAMRLRESHGVTIIGVQQPDGSWAPLNPAEPLEPGRTVLAAGPSKKLDKAFTAQPRT